jgi:hypothetical protein
MKSNVLKIIGFLFLILIIFFLVRIKQPAPLGFHGQFSMEETVSYVSSDIGKIEFLNRIRRQNIKTELYKESNTDIASLDSTRYIISNISCAEKSIKVLVELKESNDNHFRIFVLWFISEPIYNDKEYIKLTKIYYDCFGKILLKLSFKQEQKSQSS